MKFEQNLSMIYEDLNIPELFITEYFCNANGDYVKIYLYCRFLCKYQSEISPLDLSKKLSIPLKTVEEGLKYWEEQNVLIKKNKTYEFTDLKKIAVDKLYTPRLTSSLEDAIDSNEKNIVRTQAINEINTTFFQGVMSPTWYSAIDNLFNKYGFDEDVMVSLFRYCFDRQALHRNYIQAVAEGWSNSKIKTMNDLEKYYMSMEELNKVKKFISQKLNLYRSLTQFEESFVEKWTKDYNYSKDIIEIALKKTTSKSKPSFDYLDTLITDWHEKNLKSPEEVTTYLKEQKQKAKEIKAMQQNKNSGQITLQRYFDDSDQYSDMDKFYANL